MDVKNDMDNCNTLPVWNNRYNVGVDFIDSAHQKLFSVIHQLKSIVDLDDSEKSTWACSETIKFFKAYTLKHFAEEEEYMRSINYEDYEHHKSLHDDLRINVLPVLEQELEETNYSFEKVQHFLGVCLGWLSGHIIIEDSRITKKISGELEECTEEDGIKMLSDVICKMVNEMFDLEATMADVHYSGNKLDKTVNYELLYSASSDKKIRVTMILEENLVLKTVGKMPGIDFYEVDDVVLSAVMELAKVLMQRVKSMFKKHGSPYTFESDRLVTTRELKKMFKKNPPMYSLLFNTVYGSFVFCVVAA